MPDEKPKSTISTDLEAIIKKEFSRRVYYSTFEITKKLLKYDRDKSIEGTNGKILYSDSVSSDNKETLVHWINAVEALYNPNMVREVGVPEFILGLILVTWNRKHPFNRDYLTNLRDRVLKKIKIRDPDERQDSLLVRADQRGLWDEVFEPDDATGVHRDAVTSVDNLQRETFAIAITQRMSIIRTKNEESSQAITNKGFFINLNGSWGSGKSSLLELIKKKLTLSITEKWIVIYYNAWQYQRVDPSWWPLMDIVYKKSTSELKKSYDRRLLRALAVSFRENWWRFRARNMSAVYILLAFGLLGLGIASLWNPTNSFQDFTVITNDPTKGAPGYISFILSLLICIFGLRQSLISGSKDAAQGYVQQASDPMEKLSRHFESLITWIKDPVVIFIDDLDRCTGEYTVTFLEGLQTLCRKPNVIFVIAADRNWICKSYENLTVPKFRSQLAKISLVSPCILLVVTD
jgi:hypothetical protein